MHGLLILIACLCSLTQAGYQVVPVLPGVSFPSMSRSLTAAEIKSLKPTKDGTPTGKNDPLKSAGRTDIASGARAPRITGDWARNNSVPWMAAVVTDSTWFCGGSLITPGHVLTAAHCVYKGKSFRVTLGSVGLAPFNSNSSGGSRVTVTITAPAGLAVHPDFSPSKMLHDLAILAFPQPLKGLPTATINTASLPRQQQALESFENSFPWAAGWGTQENGLYPDLREMRQYVHPQKMCAERLGLQWIKPSVMCAVLVAPTSGKLGNKKIPRVGEHHSRAQRSYPWSVPTLGDAGGPLSLGVDGSYKATRFTLIGVSSYPPNGSALVAVYTRVTSHLAWISRTANLRILP